MTDDLVKRARDNAKYYQHCYNEDLEAGRDPSQFGMRWMLHQVKLWKKEEEKLTRDDAAHDARDISWQDATR